jgi:hypothetical protein
MSAPDIVCKLLSIFWNTVVKVKHYVAIMQKAGAYWHLMMFCSACISERG